MSQNNDKDHGPFTPTPSPWHNMKADVFWSVAWMSAANGLPAGTYGPLEANSSFADPETSGKYTGGPGVCMIVRYKDTPVGPYDEAIWMPGYFEVPGTGRKHARIARIYVSRVESVFNGRRNWNIPKQLANFTFHPSPTTQNPPYTKIEVSLPSNPENPFISISLNPISIPFLSRPTLPISTSYIPLNLDFAIPPIPQSENWVEDGQVGSVDGGWRISRISVSGRSAFVRVDGKIGGAGEGEGEGDSGFPDLSGRMQGWWVWVRDAELAIDRVEGEYEGK